MNDSEHPLNVRVAIEVLGYHVEKITPEWYGREVLLFFTPRWGHLVAYSWDAKSCNAIMFRNGKDEKDGNAECLPAYDVEPHDALEVVDVLGERGYIASITHFPKPRGEAPAWECHLTNRTTGDEVVGHGSDFAEAICNAALLTKRQSPPPVTEPSQEQTKP